MPGLALQPFWLKMELSGHKDDFSHGVTGEKQSCATAPHGIKDARRETARPPRKLCLAQGRELTRRWAKKQFFTSWMHFGEKYITCEHCKQFRRRLDLAHKSHMMRHMRTKYHIQQANPASTDSFAVVVPAHGDFLKVWTELSQGKAPGQGIAGYAKAARKVVKTKAVLAEAMRMLDRKFIKDKETTMSMLRDESKARLQINFAAVCEKSLDRRHTTSANNYQLCLSLFFPID